jgi:hypothetical protein
MDGTDDSTGLIPLDSIDLKLEDLDSYPVISLLHGAATHTGDKKKIDVAH